MTWHTARVGSAYDVLAPDGSEIRVLVSTSRGSMVHCALRPGQVTRAVRHRSVEEVCFCTAGAGQIWRRSAAGEAVDDLAPGSAITLPLGVDFQFRATGYAPLEVVITTMPPWPTDSAHEAIVVDGHWPSTA